jgi:predicted nucleic acid-binding protein
LGLYFLDTSALVKLYVQEPGTDRLLYLIGHSPNDRFVVLSLAAVEARSAIRRRQRAGDIDQDQADLILENLQKHMESKFIRQGVNDQVIDAALILVDRHALRAYDAVQLAGCLAIGTTDRRSLTFICSDRQLLDAARSENLAVLDPAA